MMEVVAGNFLPYEVSLNIVAVFWDSEEPIFLQSSPHVVRPGPSNINPAPARQIAPPIKSQRSGRTPSMLQSHTSDATI